MLTNSVAYNGNPFGAMDYQNNKEKILDTGIQILEYDGGISYHGKCFVIDNNLSAIGSFNWDMRSTYIDTELMLIIDSEAINKNLREAMGVYEEKSLIVAGKDDYIIPDGMVPQKISKKREIRIKLIQVFGKAFRFLM
jgi:phosphatidylserine/phosphatidylglycerophosphate/cardiolipin synthase-like enzyme